MYSVITSGRVLDGELLYTKILEVNLFAFAYRLLHRDFSPINGTFCIYNIHTHKCSLSRFHSDSAQHKRGMEHVINYN